MECLADVRNEVADAFRENNILVDSVKSTDASTQYNFYNTGVSIWFVQRIVIDALANHLYQCIANGKKINADTSPADIDIIPEENDVCEFLKEYSDHYIYLFEVTEED